MPETRIYTINELYKNLKQIYTEYDPSRPNQLFDEAGTLLVSLHPSSNFIRKGGPVLLTLHVPLTDTALASAQQYLKSWAGVKGLEPTPLNRLQTSDGSVCFIAYLDTPKPDVQEVLVVNQPQPGPTEGRYAPQDEQKIIIIVQEALRPFTDALEGVLATQQENLHELKRFTAGLHQEIQDLSSEQRDERTFTSRLIRILENHQTQTDRLMQSLIDLIGRTQQTSSGDIEPIVSSFIDLAYQEIPFLQGLIKPDAPRNNSERVIHTALNNLLRDRNPDYSTIDNIITLIDNYRTQLGNEWRQSQSPDKSDINLRGNVFTQINQTLRQLRLILSYR